MLEDAYRDIAMHLFERRGLRIEGLRREVFQRRCRERADRVGCSDLMDYLEFLKSSPQEMDALVDGLLIGYTRFFRDPYTYAVLQHRVFPEMIRRRADAGEEVLRVWCVGCATGEEAYTLGLILQDVSEKYSEKFQIHILATDRDEAALETARQGRYGRERLGDLPCRLLDRFFIHEDGTYRILATVQRTVYFAAHDVLHDPSPVPVRAVFKDFDVVSCQNVLIYYDRAAQEKIVGRLERVLEPGGVLILGWVEHLPPSLDRAFQRVDPWCAVYCKVA